MSCKKFTWPNKHAHHFFMLKGQQNSWFCSYLELHGIEFGAGSWSILKWYQNMRLDVVLDYGYCYEVKHCLLLALQPALTSSCSSFTDLLYPHDGYIINLTVLIFCDSTDRHPYNIKAILILIYFIDCYIRFLSLSPGQKQQLFCFCILLMLSTWKPYCVMKQINSLDVI